MFPPPDPDGGGGELGLVELHEPEPIRFESDPSPFNGDARTRISQMPTVNTSRISPQTSEAPPAVAKDRSVPAKQRPTNLVVCFLLPLIGGIVIGSLLVQHYCFR